LVDGEKYHVTCSVSVIDLKILEQPRDHWVKVNTLDHEKPVKNEWYTLDQVVPIEKW